MVFRVVNFLFGAGGDDGGVLHAVGHTVVVGEQPRRGEAGERRAAQSRVRPPVTRRHAVARVAVPREREREENVLDVYLLLCLSLTIRV